MVASKVELPPPWLQNLVGKTDYYDKTCKTHVSQYETRFCKTCSDTPCLCQCCLDKSVHKYHNTSQVLIVSHRVSINRADLDNIWDVNQIQPYIINGKSVNLLHEKPKKVKNGCRMCNGQMTNPNDYKYCSIQCQMKAMYGGCNIEELLQTQAEGPTSDDGFFWKRSRSQPRPRPPVLKKKKRSNLHRVSKRKVEKAAKQTSIEAVVVVPPECRVVVVPMIKSHRRKGIPHRSPMF